MYIIKGFLGNETLVNNGIGSVAQFGEISTRGLTYARDKGFYSVGTYPNLNFTSFLCLDDVGAPTIVPANVVEHLMEVSNWFYSRYNASTIGASIPTLISEFEAEFTTGDITIDNTMINALIVDSVVGTRRLPDYVLWEMVDAGPGGGEYQLKVWFSDNEFRLQYDEYELVVIPPLEDVDQFYQANSAVGTALNNVKHSDIINAAATAAGTDPYTSLNVQTYQWREHSDFGFATRNIDWYFVSYGIAGDNPDAYNQAIRDYLNDPANTSLPIGTWQEMFPEVFESSEYYIAPVWDNVVSNIPTTIYSPTIHTESAIDIAKANMAFTVGDSFWEEHLTFTTSIYQCLGILVIGSPTNTNNNDFDFRLKFADYLNLSLSHPDAGRMSPSTQGFVTFLTQLVSTAETITPSTPQNMIPSGYTRVVKSGGKIYVSGVYEGTRYLAISKHSYTVV